MENNKERFLRYLAQNMSDNEKILFEFELNKSEEMRLELAALKQKLASFKIDEDSFDERYFSSLIPKVKEKLSINTSYSKIRRGLVFATPSLAAIFIIVFFLSNSNGSLEKYSKEIADAVIENISDKDVSNGYLSMIEFENGTSKNNQSVSDLNSITIDENSKERLLSRYDSPIYEDLKSISELSDSEIESIYSKISFKK